MNDRPFLGKDDWMRLELFQTIDDSLKILNDNFEKYHLVAEQMAKQIHDIISSYNKEIIGVNTRVKSAESLREKIIRNKLYKQYDTPEEIVSNLSDLIGIMIECRFVNEEAEILNILRAYFNQKNERECSYNPEIPDFYLDLDMEQPQVQKNGLEVYRIDGYLLIDGVKVNFELQIKSLIHSFWSEVEHKVVYKNNNYILINDFLNNMLKSVYDSLIGIDNQIRLIYEHVNTLGNREATIGESTFKRVVAKAINDMFSDKMEEEMGFIIDFKKTCDILSDYILRGNESSGIFYPRITLSDLVEKIQDIKSRKVDFEASLSLEGVYAPRDAFSRILGEKLIQIWDKDFEWNLFFKMLFQIEPGNNLEDFTLFIFSLKSRFSDDKLYEDLYDYFTREEVYLIKEDILEKLANMLAEVESIEIIYEDNIETICTKIYHFVKYNIASDINSVKLWNAYKETMLTELMHSIVNACFK